PWRVQEQAVEDWYPTDARPRAVRVSIEHDRAVELDARVEALHVLHQVAESTLERVRPEALAAKQWIPHPLHEQDFDEGHDAALLASMPNGQEGLRRLRAPARSLWRAPGCGLYAWAPLLCA